MDLQNFSHFPNKLIILTVISSLIAGCGGGGGGTGVNSSISTPTPVSSPSTVPNPITANTTDDTTPESAALELLNSNREACGFGGLTRNAALDNTALNHANYMAYVTKTDLYAYASHNEQVDTRLDGTTLLNTGATNPYYSGQTLSDRLNPKLLGQNAVDTSYAWKANGENIALSNLSTFDGNYTTDRVTNAKDMLTGLFAAPYHIRTLVFPQFSEAGISYNEVKWSVNNQYNYTYLLEMVTALPTSQNFNANTKLLNYPCDGVTTAYELINEEPNPFGNSRDLNNNPIGQPIYVLAPADKVIASASATLTANGITTNIEHILMASNDPNNILDKVNDRNEVIFMPDQPLRPNTTYTASYRLTYSNGQTVTKSFSFKTKS